jgi:hypothetical protein
MLMSSKWFLSFPNTDVMYMRNFPSSTWNQTPVMQPQKRPCYLSFLDAHQKHKASNHGSRLSLSSELYIVNSRLCRRKRYAVHL